MNSLNQVLIRKKVLAKGMDRPFFSPTLPLSMKKVLIEETDHPLPPSPPGELVVTRH
jgi:hypothetical protein